jgi:hypothetical protein
MEVSYVEGLASYGGPESCVYIREGVGEALTGGCAGRVLSCVIHAPGRKAWDVRGAEVVETHRRPHRACRGLGPKGEAGTDPAQSETPRMRASTLIGNREIPRPSVARREAFAAERIEKPSGVQR